MRRFRGGGGVYPECIPKEIEQAAGIILPGVAAFGFAIGQLGETGEVIKEVVRAGKPSFFFSDLWLTPMSY